MRTLDHQFNNGFLNLFNTAKARMTSKVLEVILRLLSPNQLNSFTNQSTKDPESHRNLILCSGYVFK